jgi:signal transduction histidine kinase
VLVSALTLAVAAITLLSPLDQRLRENALDNLSRSVTTQRGLLTSLPGGAVRQGDPRMLRAIQTLRRRNGAEIGVFTATGQRLVDTDPDTANERYAGVPAAGRTGRVQRMVTGSGAQAEAQIAVPISIHEHDVTLTARKPVDDARDTRVVVTRAFAYAAGAGLAGALLAGLLLAQRLVARIRRVRDTALRVAEIGPVAELRPEHSRDEIGDLSRAFALMQQRLREQEQARRAFVATASHELRTPLASLRVMLDLLIDDLDAEPAAIARARTQAVNADVQAERLSQLAAELLDLSRLDAGVPVRAELVDLEAILRSVVAELGVRLTEQGRDIHLQLGEARWAVGDPGSVAQILRILLDNALRYSSGDVRATTEARDGMVAVVVANDGAGVAPEDRERIFERFARGSAARDGGFGLGLAIGRELARRMDGYLTLEDTAGETRFALRIRSAPAP